MAIVEKLESTLKLSSFGYTPNQKQLDYILEQDVANSFFLGGMIIESHYIENYFSTFLSIVLYNFGFTIVIFFWTEHLVVVVLHSVILILLSRGPV